MDAILKRIVNHQNTKISRRSLWPADHFDSVYTLWNSTQHILPIMITSSNGKIFRVTDPLWGESTGHGGFPLQRPVTRSFHVFFDLHLNKRLSKQSRRRWFETPSRWLWRHCNAYIEICGFFYYFTKLKFPLLVHARTICKILFIMQ